MRPGGSLLRVRVLFCLLGVSESALLPFLPLLLGLRGFDPQTVGAVLALMSAVAFAAAPTWGLVADRLLGDERALGFGLAATAVAALVFAATRSPVAVVAAGVLLWAMRSPFMALADSMALARLGPDRRGAYGGVRLWMSAGFAVGAIVFGALVEVSGLELVAPLYAALCTLNASAFAVVLRGRSLGRPQRAAAAGPRDRAVLTALPALSLFLVALLLTYAAYSAAYNFGSVRIAALGGGAVFVGLAAGLQAGAEVPSMAWTRRLAKRFRPGTVFAAGGAVYVLVYVGWSLAASPALLAVLRLVAGLGFGLTYVGSVLVIDELVPPQLRATGQAVSKAVAFGLAPVLGLLCGGLVYGYLGAPAFFAGAALVTAGAALLAGRTAGAGLPRKQPQLEHA